MPDIGGPELIIILVVVLVLFGGSQLPKLARNLGQAQKEFKKGIDHGDDDDKDKGKKAAPIAADATPAAAPVAAAAPAPAAAPLAACPCGSGKSFQDCHGANAPQA